MTALRQSIVRQKVSGYLISMMGGDQAAVIANLIAADLSSGDIYSARVRVSVRDRLTGHAPETVVESLTHVLTSALASCPGEGGNVVPLRATLRPGFVRPVED